MLNFRLGAFGALALATLLFASTASAALPYWWFTPMKANRAVVAKNFQLWSSRYPDAHTKISKSACKGYGLAKRANGLHYYRHFICKATWSYDANPPTQYGPGPFTSALLCDTTKAKPLGIKCQISA